MKREQGYNTIEMLLVMILLCLFGVAIFTLIISGTKTYERVNATRTSQEDARTAISYVEIRLRQSDIENQISLVPGAVEGADALRIDNPFYGNTTWIFYANGAVQECVTMPDEEPSLALAMAIVAVESLDLLIEDNSVAIEVGYTTNDVRRKMRTRVYLRTKQNTLEGVAS